MIFIVRKYWLSLISVCKYKITFKDNFKDHFKIENYKIIKL
jgi:hypothetical protein